jgi:hypothetical protein
MSASPSPRLADIKETKTPCIGRYNGLADS